MTITEFLLARVAEDESDAHVMQAPNYVDLTSGWVAGRVGGTFLGHLARWSPDRVLAECEAKRRIVALHQLVDGCCARCTANGEYPADDAHTDEQNWPCPTLRALAAVYADHPDYDPAWAPR